MDATSDAFLYALRINPLSYDQLFEAMATYVSCTYGPAAHAELNAILCNHGIRDCAAPAPMACETCGNGVREGNESCDGDDWLHTSCDELPLYSGGMLACDPVTCTLDESQCVMPGLDSTAGTMTPDESTTEPASDTATVTGTDAGLAGSASDGCDCHVPATDDSRAVVLPLLLLAARRRRRSTCPPV